MFILHRSPLVNFEAAAPSGYYVSAIGNDSNPGTFAQPWQTIDKVNTITLVPGDSVYFRGGDTFTGNLLISPAVQPSPGDEINVASYGTGKATINGGDSYAIKILDCGYVNVSNINLIGAQPQVSGTIPNKVGTTTSTDALLLAEATTESTWYAGLNFDGVDVDGGLFGIHLYSSFVDGTAAFENWTISNCTTTNTGVVGIWVSATGSDTYPHDRNGVVFRNGTISNCYSTNSPGITDFRFYGPDVPLQTGFGIFVLNSENITVEGCLARNCGDASSKFSPGGPVGIIFVECRDSVMTGCEASDIYATSGVDGEAFDFDAGCQDCILEYSYGHDCDGPGVFIYQFGAHSSHFGSVVRYNIFEHVSRNNYAPIQQFSGTGTPLIYQNTVYHEPSAFGRPADAVGCDSAALRNNVFYVLNGGKFGGFGTGGVTGNTYFAGSGSTFSVVHNGSTYTSLSAMHTAGLEKDGATNVGASGDPEFANPGAGTDVLPDDPVDTLSNYDLGGTSAAHGAGVDLSDFGITPPATDWHGNAASVGGVFDSGAVRFGST